MVKETIFLPIVFHFHQPVGNFEYVLEDCFKKSYSPLIQNLFEFPKVKATLHFSGNLLDWLINKKPNFINKIKKMVKRGQVEIMGGGYYEPIYAIIPDRDKVNQIEKLSILIKNHFDLVVKGAWLSERVWEPHYPTFLNEAGLRYIILDDNHFRSTGISEEETFYSYITEDNGKAIRIFPINEKLRYLIPWKPTTYTFDYLKSIAKLKGNPFALLISDAEKLGVWGSTHEFCYIDGKGHTEGDNKQPFIPLLFEKISQFDWVETITLSEYMEKYSAKKLIYLPTSSYDKMEEWVLPTAIRKRFEEYRNKYRDNDSNLYRFLKGGFWRYFLVKYPEANNMHKKMLYVRNKLIQLEDRKSKLKDHDKLREINNLLENAWEEIYKAQCNDAYWHGLFGGIYLQFLRFANYSYLINAENYYNKALRILLPNLNSTISITTIDFNKNSKLEYLIESDKLNLYIDPSDGGTIFELDFKPKSYNLLNTITRWKEAYHNEKKIDSNEILIDQFRRSMLRLRIFSKNSKLDELESNAYKEFGNFIDASFRVIKNEKIGKKAHLIFENNGFIKLPNPGLTLNIKCHIIKELTIEENRINIIIKGGFHNDIPPNILKRIVDSLNLGCDIPFFFNGDPNKFKWISEKNELGQTKEESLIKSSEHTGNCFKAYDETYDLEYKINFQGNGSSETKILKFPLNTYIYTENGYKSMFQGINLIPIFNLNKSFKSEINIKIL